MTRRQGPVFLHLDTEYSDVLGCVWREYDQTGQRLTIESVAGALKDCSLDEVMRGLRAAEEAGWIALHLEDEREIEVFKALPKAFRMPVHPAE